MFSVSKYALQCISHRKFVSTVFIALTFISTLSTFGTGVFTENMQSGVEQTRGQIGADVVVVPSDYSEDAKNALFAGDACTILLSKNIVGDVSKIEGVKNASPQLYLETLTLSCCTAGGVQLIAFDPETDFTVGKWLDAETDSNLNSGEVIVGSSTGLKKNGTVEIYGREFTVAQVLDETGMGYDVSLFISYESANEITSSAKYSSLFGEKKNLASMILINTADGYDADSLQYYINTVFRKDGIVSYATDEMVQQLTKKLNYFKTFSFVMNLFVVILSATALFSLITLTFYRSRNRVGSLMSVGVGKKKIIGLFLTEYLYLIAAGTVVGILLVCIFVFPLHTAIKDMLDLPYRFVGVKRTILLMAKTVLINLGMLLLSASFSFVKILKYEPAILAEEQS
jgi:putative ABC transport system permease protein